MDEIWGFDKQTAEHLKRLSRDKPIQHGDVRPPFDGLSMPAMRNMIGVVSQTISAANPPNFGSGRVVIHRRNPSTDQDAVVRDVRRYTGTVTPDPEEVTVYNFLQSSYVADPTPHVIGPETEVLFLAEDAWGTLWVVGSDSTTTVHQFAKCGDPLNDDYIYVDNKEITAHFADEDLADYTVARMFIEGEISCWNYIGPAPHCTTGICVDIIQWLENCSECDFCWELNACGELSGSFYITNDLETILDKTVEELEGATLKYLGRCYTIVAKHESCPYITPAFLNNAENNLSLVEDCGFCCFIFIPCIGGDPIGPYKPSEGDPDLSDFLNEDGTSNGRVVEIGGICFYVENPLSDCSGATIGFPTIDYTYDNCEACRYYCLQNCDSGDWIKTKVDMSGFEDNTVLKRAEDGYCYKLNKNSQGPCSALLASPFTIERNFGSDPEACDRCANPRFLLTPCGADCDTCSGYETPTTEIITTQVGLENIIGKFIKVGGQCFEVAWYDGVESVTHPTITYEGPFDTCEECNDQDNCYTFFVRQFDEEAGFTLNNVMLVGPFKECQNQLADPGCGITFALGKIGVNPYEIVGDGLKHTAASGGEDPHCRIDVNVGCGLELEGEEGNKKVQVKPEDLIGQGLEIDDEDEENRPCAIRVKLGCGLGFDDNDAVEFVPGNGLHKVISGESEETCSIEVKPGCGIQVDASGVSVKIGSGLTCDEYGLHASPIDVDAGCGIIIDGGTISVANLDLAGLGLVAGSGCTLDVAVGCGLKIAGLGELAFDAATVAGCGLIGTDCTLSVDLTGIAGAGLVSESGSGGACGTIKVGEGCGISVTADAVSINRDDIMGDYLEADTGPCQIKVTNEELEVLTGASISLDIVGDELVVTLDMSYATIKVLEIVSSSADFDSDSVPLTDCE